MNIYIFGNGNLSFSGFMELYAPALERYCDDPSAEFTLCDFRGTDVLAMEFLKCRTANVAVYHVGDRPRYFPDTFRTCAGSWKRSGDFAGDGERDAAAIAACTHFLAVDFNSDAKRKSGTQKNIERCLQHGKIRL